MKLFLRNSSTGTPAIPQSSFINLVDGNKSRCRVFIENADQKIRHAFHEQGFLLGTRALFGDLDVDVRHFGAPWLLTEGAGFTRECRSERPSK